MVMRVVPTVVLAALFFSTAGPTAAPQETPAEPAVGLDEAHRLFYNAQYAAAAALTRDLCSTDIKGLAACELRSSAILFQIRRALGPENKEKINKEKKEDALKRCTECAALLTEFQETLTRGQSAARAHLQAAPDDEQTLFLLGKLDLNHVWLHLGTLGRKTGWREYWEARRALDQVLKQHPSHVRARVARAWIDYIVDTKMPRGTRWLLGGGSKKRGLLAVREAASMDAAYYARVEARFALWDMQVREKDFEDAVITARGLAQDFPQNQELNKFVEAHRDSAQRESVQR